MIGNGRKEDLVGKIRSLFKREEEKKEDIGILMKGDFPTTYFDGYTRFVDVPEVAAGIDIIANLISNMTIHLMENTDTGDMRVRNGLSYKVDVNPYSKMTRKDFMYLLVRTMLEEGNQVTMPIHNDTYELIDLVPIKPKDIAFETKAYNYRIKVGDRYFESDEVLHFKLNPKPNDPFKGQGYRVHLKPLTENLEQAQKTKKGFMKSEYLPSIVVRVDANSEKFKSPEGRQAFIDEYLKGNESGAPMIIPSSLMDVQSIKPLTLKDIDINSSVEIDKKTAAAVLDIPAFLLGVGDFKKDEYNNFISRKIMSIAKNIEQVLTKGLVYTERYYFHLNPRSIMQYSITELAEVGKNLRAIGVMTGNEVRDSVGYSPAEGLDEFVMLENYLSVEDIRNQKKLDNKGGE